MSSVAAEPMPMASNTLARELWISFSGLLRSHVAMRSVAEPKAGWQIVSNEPSSIEVGALGNRLWVTAPESSRPGSAAWVPQVRVPGTPTRGASGAPEHYTIAETALAQSEKSERFTTFSFAEDGSVFFDSPSAPCPEPMEMEVAVEFLLNTLRDRRSI